MKKIIFTLCAFSVGLIDGISQNITYKIGSEYESTDRHKDFGYFLTSNGSASNISYFRPNDFSIQPINLNTLNVGTGFTHDISILGKDACYEKILNLKDNLFYIYSDENKKSHTRVLSAVLMDDSNKSVTNKPIVLFESPEPKVIYYAPLTPTRYYFNMSSNKEFALITCLLPDKEKRAKLNKKQMGFCVIDKNLEVKLSKVVEMPYIETLMNLRGYNVDSKGNVFMLLSFSREKEDGTKEFGGYELVRIATDGSLQKKELTTNGASLNNCMFTDDLNGNLVITGHYSKSGARGIYIYRFGPDADTKSAGAGIKFYEFSKELFKAYENDANQEEIDKTGRLDASLYFDDIFFHPNGDIVIVNEQYKVEASNDRIKNYYFDIIAMKANSEGKLVWMKKIPKNQRGAGRSDLSYKYHYNNGNDYFIFIDNEKNLNLAIDEAPKAHICRQGGYLVAVKLDPIGNMQKIPIFDLRNEDISVFPFDMLKVNENTLIGKCSRNRKKTVIELNFK